MYNRISQVLFLHLSPRTIFDLVNHENGMQNVLTSQFTETSTCSSDISRRCTCYPSISEDPLLSLPYLSPNPPEFTPMPRLTQARLDILKINPDGFLWPEEEKLFIMVFKNNKKALAYNEEE